MTEPAGDGPSVIVVGGGPSGLAASKVDFFFSFTKVIGSALYSLRGGMQTYTDALADRLDVVTDARVQQVTESADSATVTWKDAEGVERTEEADAAVVAVWGNQVPELVPSLHPSCREYLMNLDYTASVNLNVALSAPPKGIPAAVICVPGSVQPNLFGVVLEHNKAPGRVPAGKGLAGLYTMSRWSKVLLGEDDEVVTKRVLEAAERVLPGLSDLVEFVEVNRWDPVVVYSRPGTYRRLAEFNAHRPRRRIHLAGDYFACSNLNTATAAGERAARELLAVLPPE